MGPEFESLRGHMIGKRLQIVEFEGVFGSRNVARDITASLDVDTLLPLTSLDFP